MIKQVTGTIVSRLFITAMNLLVMMLAGHALGADGLGSISLLVLGITLVMLPANLIGGGALVYLVPRARLGRLLVPSYAWAVVSAVVAFAILRVFPLVPAGYEGHVCALAFLQAIYSANLGVLLGQQRIARHNLVNALHAVTLLGTFALLLTANGGAAIMDYVHASYAAFGLTALLSALSIDRRHRPSGSEDVPVFRTMLKQGAWVQGANGLQLLNYRLAYWLIEPMLGRPALGLYSVGNQLAESAWIAPRSLGMVLLSRVSNNPDREAQRRLTLTTTKVAIAVAVAVIGVLIALPGAVFQWTFGPEVVGLRPIVLLLAPGIVCMAASQALSHYFSGTGMNQHNLVGSGLGMLITVGLGWWLIGHHGLQGAAITASLAYAASVVYQCIVFLKHTSTRIVEFFPDDGDMQRLRGMWRSMSGG